MVTNYPHPTTAHEGLRTTAGTTRTGGRARLMAMLSQLVCGANGHDMMLHFEDERMSLRCVSCGHETPGWELNAVPPTVTVRGDAPRQAVTRPHLVSTRRVA